jgi:hypothetical protein
MTYTKTPKAHILLLLIGCFFCLSTDRLDNYQGADPSHAVPLYVFLWLLSRRVTHYFCGYSLHRYLHPCGVEDAALLLLRLIRDLHVLIRLMTMYVDLQICMTTTTIATKRTQRRRKDRR